MRRPLVKAVPVGADPWQRLVVEHTTGPLLVIGGPGTGKTTTLVEAVAARVGEGVDPERILVLTFGRRGAVRLRDRIEARLGRSSGLRTTAEPMVRTFHGYAFGLLRRAAVERGEPSPRLLTGPEQDLVIRELLAESPAPWPESLKGALATRAFATELRDLLLRAVERGVPPSGLAELARIHRRADWAAAARFFKEYLQVLALRDATTRGSVAYDYAELVRAASGLLADEPERLAAERRRLSFVYVDELPDTDPAQIELLELIAGNGAHLVAFADPDSSTFAFRGTDPTIVGDFPDRFPTLSGAPAPQVTLPHSRRIGAGLLAATQRVAARLRGPSRHRRLESVRPGGSVETRTFPSETSEAAFLSHRLREAHLLRGVPWSRMAVIVRSTARQLAPLQRALHSAGVPTVTEAEDLPLHLQPAIAPLLLLLRCALDDARLDEDAAVALLHSPLGGADPLAERRLRQGLRALALAAGDRRPSGVLLVRALRDPAELAMVERRWATPARAVARLLQEARDTAARPGATAEEVLWAVWHASGLADRWSAVSARGGHRGSAADRDLDAVVSLFDAAARFTDRLPGAGTAVFLDHVEGQDLPADSLAPSADRGDAVRILTAHAAKGLEWDVVAVAGVQEGVWPDLRLRGSVLGSELLVEVLAGRTMETMGRLAAMLDEERRLFYVAVTRAREQVLVTAVASGDGEEQPSRFLTELSSDAELDGQVAFETPRALTLPTLVAELRVALVDLDATDAERAAAAAVLARLAAEGVPGADPGSWWGLPALSDDRPLVDPGEAVQVTPSTVESVDRCSLRWLLERHGGALTPSPEQSIGNLVHAAAMLASDATADRAQLVAYVADRFDAIELSARWLAGRERDRAEHMLDKLIGWLAGNPRRLVSIEQDFLVELADPEAPVEIKGRVDRLELDEQGRLVVVDLKTGKTIPANANLAEHPQLAAYQAAIELGAFEESSVAGGASLVQLGGETNTAREQVQLPLAEADDPNWARALVQRTAKTMAASTFSAVVNNKCRVCPVKTSCPVSGKGRHVTGPGA
ncbi:ATP-dependent DNA helicase [Dactylosporangium sp. AC04546]|uniref:ATP-dependent helicase n=1 Tax=Dactylosporangium sp. AC04546 TaxID=2862460 RepID=UPI001EDF338E|nr:ATP-dependent DNA helicase [Dactylosporangium sp. AC04546]WVK89477.1 ATP-dependent DNA helicase [Dactylosporangium sp. AC04546]